MTEILPFKVPMPTGNKLDLSRCDPKESMLVNCYLSTGDYTVEEARSAAEALNKRLMEQSR